MVAVQPLGISARIGRASWGAVDWGTMISRRRAAALFVPASSPVPRRVHLQGHVSCMASSARYLKFSCQRRGRCFSQRTIVLTT